MEYTLHVGDSQVVLQGIEENSVDSVVTDPPYGLSDHKPKDVLECLSAWIAGDAYKTDKKGFMAKTWDSWVPGPEVWREVYRVLKPGGYVLAFAGTRTMDLMAIALRLAGFEYRDTVMYVFGSGFPKSHNVANDIDKLMGKGPRGHAIATVSNIHQGTGRYLQPGENLERYESRTEASKPYQGFGTALKPAYEPVLMFRKPIEGTVARNVLKWGTGGLNIGECRVPGQQLNTPDSGRFPANFIHDGSNEVTRLFPVTISGGGNRNGAQKGDVFHGVGDTGTPRPFPSSTGSAARFFYCSKASRRDRDEGLDTYEAKRSEYRPNESEDGYGGNSLSARLHNSVKKCNHHPTVKPTDLMCYLVRLVTPPGGTVLDPFMGSGSTGKAAMYEGFDFVGIELDSEYAAIAEKRIEYAIREAEREKQQLELWG